MTAATLSLSQEVPAFYRSVSFDGLSQDRVNWLGQRKITVKMQLQFMTQQALPENRQN